MFHHTLEHTPKPLPTGYEGIPVIVGKGDCLGCVLGVCCNFLGAMYLPICVLSTNLWWIRYTRLAGCLKAPLSTTLVAQPMRWAVYRKRKHDGKKGGYCKGGYGSTKISVKIWWTDEAEEIWCWNVFMKMEWDHGIIQLWIHLARIKTHESCQIVSVGTAAINVQMANHPAGTWSNFLRFHPSCRNLPARCDPRVIPWSDFPKVSDQEKIFFKDVWELFPRQT